MRFVIGKVWKQLAGDSPDHIGCSWVGDVQLPPRPAYCRPRSPSNSIWNIGSGAASTAFLRAGYVFPYLRAQTQQLLGSAHKQLVFFGPKVHAWPDSRDLPK